MKVVDKTEIKESPLSGKGLFSTTLIKKGEKIGTMKGFFTSKEHPHCLWISDTRALRVTNKYKYANHEWQKPNAKLKGYTLYAIKNIKKGEEIVWDYSCGYNYEQKFSLKKPLYDNNGLGIIHNAILSENIPLIQDCIKKYKPNLFLKPKHKLNKIYSLPPIFYAVANGADKSAQYLCRYKKETLKMRTEEDHNILHWAVVMRDFFVISNQTFDFLVNSFAPLLKVSNGKTTPASLLFDQIDFTNVKTILNHLDFNEIFYEFNLLSPHNKKKFVSIALQHNLKIKTQDPSQSILTSLDSGNYLLTLII